MKTIYQCNLADFNSYRITSRCRVAYFPESIEDLQTIFQCIDTKSSYVLIGSGHNVILAREEYQSPFIIFNGNASQIAIQQNHLTAGAGAFTKDVCEMAATYALSGFEMFYDIPSSIGGAVVMNAGAKDEDIAGILESATYYDINTKTITTLPNEVIGFRYRNSLFQNDPSKIIMSATFRLQKGDPLVIREKMNGIKAERWSKQPRDYPNAGSVFKRPSGRFVGPMLDELGLKGHAVAGFRISPKHSGFIEKVGSGNGSHLLELIDDIQNRVRQHFGVHLEIEQRIIDSP